MTVFLCGPVSWRLPEKCMRHWFDVQIGFLDRGGLLPWSINEGKRGMKLRFLCIFSSTKREYEWFHFAYICSIITLENINNLILFHGSLMNLMIDQQEMSLSDAQGGGTPSPVKVCHAAFIRLYMINFWWRNWLSENVAHHLNLSQALFLFLNQAK